MISEEELDEMRARCDAATPGPWHTYQEELSKAAGIENNYAGHICGGCEYEGYFAGPDADFVAHARTDLPRCIKEIQALKAVQDALTETCDRYAQEIERLSK